MLRTLPLISLLVAGGGHGNHDQYFPSPLVHDQGVEGARALAAGSQDASFTGSSPVPNPGGAGDDDDEQPGHLHRPSVARVPTLTPAWEEAADTQYHVFAAEARRCNHSIVRRPSRALDRLVALRGDEANRTTIPVSSMAIHCKPPRPDRTPDDFHMPRALSLVCTDRIATILVATLADHCFERPQMFPSIGAYEICGQLQLTQSLPILMPQAILLQAIAANDISDSNNGEHWQSTQNLLYSMVATLADYCFNRLQTFFDSLPTGSAIGACEKREQWQLTPSWPTIVPQATFLLAIAATDISHRENCAYWQSLQTSLIFMVTTLAGHCFNALQTPFVLMPIGAAIGACEKRGPWQLTPNMPIMMPPASFLQAIAATGTSQREEGEHWQPA